MRSKGFLILVILTFVALLAGCQTQLSQGNYTDDLGRNIVINKIPQRIISLSPSNTEIVYALGLEDRLIGVTTYCNYPEAVRNKPKVSEFSTVDTEKIVSLQPDLILADSIHKTTVIPAFEKLDIPVVGIDPSSLDNILFDLELIGKLSGETKSSEALTENLRTRIRTVTGKTEKLDPAVNPRVFFLTWHDPLWTAGAGTLINDLITKAGGINIASDLSGHSQIDLETVIQRNPQIILVMSSMGDQNMSLEYLKNESRFQAVDALKKNQVFAVDTDIFGRTTPRSVDALEEASKIIHPELFK
jgi:iron complex transport system substrate-binding protein